MLFMYFLVLVYVRRQYYYIVHTTISTHSFAANNILVRFGIFLYLLGITRQILFLYYRRMVSSRKTKYFAGSNDWNPSDQSETMDCVSPSGFCRKSIGQKQRRQSVTGKLLLNFLENDIIIIFVLFLKNR